MPCTYFSSCSPCFVICYGFRQNNLAFAKATETYEVTQNPGKKVHAGKKPGVIRTGLFVVAL
jgi:hypothetical protein